MFVEYNMCRNIFGGDGYELIKRLAGSLKTLAKNKNYGGGMIIKFRIKI